MPIVSAGNVGMLCCDSVYKSSTRELDLASVRATPASPTGPARVSWPAWNYHWKSFYGNSMEYLVQTDWDVKMQDRPRYFVHVVLWIDNREWCHLLNGDVAVTVIVIFCPLHDVILTTSRIYVTIFISRACFMHLLMQCLITAPSKFYNQVW